MQTKVCSRCKQTLPKTSFGKALTSTAHDKLQRYCRPCQEVYRLERVELTAQINRRTRYGLEQETYERMKVEQRGLCRICGKVPQEKGFAVDHDHKTGKVRGLLCHPCNRGLGQFGDDPARLLAALKYLLG